MSNLQPPKPPRSFKFVGGPSRKRRKPNSFAPKPPQRVASITDTSRNPNSKPGDDKNSGDEKRSQCGASLHPPSQSPPQPKPTADHEGGHSETMIPSSSQAPTSMSILDSSLPWPVEATDNDGNLLWDSGNQHIEHYFDSMDPSFLLMPFLDNFDDLASSEDLTTTPSNSDTGNSENNDSTKCGTHNTMDNTTIVAGSNIVPKFNAFSSTIGDTFLSGNGLNELLAQYDQEFCIWPLTSDFEANPFRCGATARQDSQLLLHSILALSYRHINRVTGTCSKEAKEHKALALKLLNETQSEADVLKIDTDMLDAILVLFTLDCATSAYGSWTSQLRSAHRVLVGIEENGKPRTRRIQAQIAMLVWWDVTLALTVRKGCVLPQTYHSDLRNYNPDGKETFYSVSGCPEELFRYMMRIGQYAREVELVATMTCVTFDNGPILAVEESIRNWNAREYSQYSYDDATLWTTDTPSTDGRDLEEIVNYRQDLHHCAEAWRYTLLLYIQRVFKWDRKSQPPSLLALLGRRILNHVASCRRSTLLQKQLLLPVFFAGCETKDPDLQRIVKEYCEWWSAQTRYDMFLTASALLEEIWSKSSPLDWWGSVVDEKSQPNVNGDSRQYLFG
ncbi:uncharacterized protein CTRU02_205237 [Colletotrichum truncatum]|uniref:Uncharacterized protein n=1 Tax=Colletotrichum truncatum TaxID=5467 RepID=A0ACC3Z3I0_COLTU|nr:uncharacterized protein CTRU02_15760 [Colletotrichum truncatum]XP_036585432.1 uncharacterized protein CTRU02_04293 [Colletotrichum truncatum]KAF6780687.1 hypothetical protein CTRU02_15760 [Colletotrichum truncatum]KAF6795483.1 hypothetical protein CTRU02_04293 [Colletotrichum truncatum]